MDKEQERFFVEVGRATLPAFPEGDLVPLTDREPPDFLVREHDRVVGVEVSALMHQKKFEREQFFAGVLEEAERQYVAQGGRPLQVSFFWRDHAKLDRKRNALAQTVAQALFRWWPSDDSTHAEIGYERLAESGLADHLHSVHVWRCDGISRCNFVAPRADYVSSPKMQIERRIAAKDEKIDEYRKHCDAVWLLVVAEGASLARTYDMDAVNELRVASRFDQVVLLDLFRSRAYSLGLLRERVT